MLPTRLISAALLLSAWGDRHDIPIKANPDGTIAQIRIPNEQRVYLTSTFSF